MKEQKIKKPGKRPSLSLPKLKKNRTPIETALRKRKRLKYIAVLPTTVTLLNAVCGFFSIVYASRGPGVLPDNDLLNMADFSFFAISGYLILAAMIADVLDGQVARWSGTASSFGGQLDSLSDVLSFGAAPAFLMLKVVEARINLDAFEQIFFFPVSLWKNLPLYNLHKVQMAENWILFAAIFFMLCTITRLARFNVENDTDLSRHQSFAGLPSPAAAGVVVSLVIFLEDYLPGITDQLPNFSAALADICIWILPLAALLCGILMVSRIRYSHLVNRLFRKKKNFTSVLLVLFTGFLVALNIQLTILVGFWFFAIAGFVRSIYADIERIHSKKKTTAHPLE